VKILIVGDSGSIFIKQYIEYVLLNKGAEIILVQEGQTPKDYETFYNQNSLVIEPLKQKANKLIMDMPIIRSFLGCWIWAKIVKRKYGEFDFIHIHGLNRSRGNLGKYLRKYTKKLAITVWGDELLRAKTKTLKKYHKYYDISDYITVPTSQMYNSFLEVYGNIYTKKISINKFAIGEFDYIDQVQKLYTREQLLKEFGILDSSKKLVFIGHNGREAQRHLELIDALKMLPQKYISKIILVCTMTYGVKSQEYLQSMENQIKALGCQYIILREFLNEEKIAKLRNICDILIHAQLTDAFSASIQESLYAGAIVLNGEWLKYDDLSKEQPCLVEYSTMQDMVVKLQDVLDNYLQYKNCFKANKEILRNLSSVEATTKLWEKNLHL